MSRRRIVAALVFAITIAGGCGPDARVESPRSRPIGSQGPGPDGGAVAPPPNAVWQAATVLPPDVATFHNVVGEHGAILGDRTAWVRVDGPAWLPGELVEPSDTFGMVAWHGRFVAWADESEVRVSADGLTWETAAVGPDEANLFAIVPLENQLLLFGEATRTTIGAWRSLDGSRWSPIKEAPLGLVAGTVWPGRGVVAVGAIRGSATVSTVEDGGAWTSQPPPTSDADPITLSGVAAGVGGVVAIGDIGGRAAAWSTSDLLAWTGSDTAWGDDAFLESISAVGGGLAIAGRRHARPVIWLSTDGRAWTAVDLPLAAGLEGDSAAVRFIDDGLVVFGYTTTNEGNGGSSRTGYLVWTVAPNR